MTLPNDIGGASGDTPPEFWSKSADLPGVTVLSYAVRKGASFVFLVALGGVLTVYCSLTMLKWLTEGEFGLMLVLMLVLIPGSGFLIGLRCLDIALYAQTHYVLAPNTFAARRLSLFGTRTVEIPRPAIVAVHQQYSRPGPSEPSTSPGTWTTFISHRDRTLPDVKDLAIEGMHTPDEAKWLGRIFADWAGMELKRGFNHEFDEADPAELPQL